MTFIGKGKYEKIREKQRERLAILHSYGVKGGIGTYLGVIQLTATESEKLIKLLKRLSKIKELSDGK